YTWAMRISPLLAWAVATEAAREAAQASAMTAKRRVGFVMSCLLLEWKHSAMRRALSLQASCQQTSHLILFMFSPSSRACRLKFRQFCQVNMSIKKTYD